MNTVMGIIVPVDWDDEGVASRFAIYSFDEKEYCLESGFSRAEMLELVQQEVKVVGRIIEENGDTRFHVMDLYPLGTNIRETS